MIIIPTEAINLEPNLSDNRPAKGERSTINTGSGNMRIPDMNGLTCRITCR